MAIINLVYINIDGIIPYIQLELLDLDSLRSKPTEFFSPKTRGNVFSACDRLPTTGMWRLNCSIDDFFVPCFIALQKNSWTFCAT